MILLSTNYFILFRNPDYAKELEKAFGGKICSTKSKLFGITPKEDDVFLVDAHFEGQMSSLNGLDILKEYLFFHREIKFNVKVYSWFTAEYIHKNYPDKSFILKLSNIQYLRFPVIIS